MAKVLMLIGGALLVLGALLHFLPGAFGWFGRLPGDIRIEGERGGFYFPLVSMILVSILLSLLFSWLRR